MKRCGIIQLLCGAVVSAALLASCSAQKNTAASRRYQAFITRYNVYYNGNKHYQETLADMEQKYADDYTSTLYLHPAEAYGNSQAPQPSGDFKRSIEKAQKSIQLHSIKKRPARKSGKSSDAQKAWLKREEYNPFIHNAWMMMGRSQYMGGDFLGAAATFYYISRHFGWLPSTVAEAQLWQARSYVAADWPNEAEGILKRVKRDELPTTGLQRLYDFVEADIAVRRRDYSAAITPLRSAIKGASGAQRVRLNFLLGQCYSAVGDRRLAYKAYGAAAGGGGATYRTKLNARIKQSEVYSGKNIAPEVRALRRLTSQSRNKEYLDQIYYAIGNLYLSRGDTAHAVENYVLASEKSTRQGIEKAINDITLGEIYFAQGKYDKAQPCYSSSVSKLPEDYPNLKLLRRRSDVLDELSVYANNVTIQDSLLRLAAMPEKERLAVIDRIISDLKKKEKEEAEEAARAEHEATAAANAGSMTSSAKTPQQFQMNSDDSWYFYNTATVAAGRTTFQRTWGSRKLEDDWRRRNKSTYSFSDFDSADTDEDSDSAQGDSLALDRGANAELTDSAREAMERVADPHYREYYLAQIPTTDEQKQTSHEVIQEGLYTMGSILRDKLEDFPAARRQWDRLLRDYPDNVYRLDVYYNLYMMYMRLEQPAEADPWRTAILTDFADSKYGVALQDPNYVENLRQMPQVQRELYDRAYTAYLENRNSAVHDTYQEMMRRYPVAPAMPKFMFLHALAYVTEKKPDEFNVTLRELLERYPETDISPVASAYLKGMAAGRKLNADATSNLRGMIWDISLGSAAGGNPDSIAAAEFDFNPNQPMLLALVYSTDEVSANALLFAIARHNFNTFVVKDFDLEQLTFGRLGMLLVKGFANENEVNHYISVMEKDRELTLPSEVTPVVISQKNFETLISHGATFEQYFRAAAEASLDHTEQQAALPDDDSAPEEPAAEEQEEPLNGEAD